MTARVLASSSAAAVSAAAVAAALDVADAADAERQPQREVETPAALLTPGGGAASAGGGGSRRRQQAPGPQGRQTQLAPALRQPQGRRADQPRRNVCCGPVSYFVPEEGRGPRRCY